MKSWQVEVARTMLDCRTERSDSMDLSNLYLSSYLHEFLTFLLFAALNWLVDWILSYLDFRIVDGYLIYIDIYIFAPIKYFFVLFQPMVFVGLLVMIFHS